jgi:hypothetical protein
MERKICPYLGLPDDAKTSLSFPSEGNFCHRADPSAAVNHDHQAGYCLTGKHTACPVFLARVAAPLPPAMAVPQSVWERARQKMGGSFVPVAVLALVLTAILFTTTQAARTAAANDASPAWAQSQVSGMSLLGGTALPAANPLLPQSPRSEPETVKDCPLPQGWQAYTVQPTDSLFRISTIYGVSVAALQAANCMDEQTFLAHGTSLFVPILPTPAPTATVIVYTAIAAPDSGGSDDDGDKPAVVAAPDKVVQPAQKPDDGKDKGKGKGKGKDRDDDDDDDDEGKGKGDD